MSGPIFCDSRGEGLAQNIFESTGESECVFTFQGATIKSLANEICSFLEYSDPEYIYFSAGVNNLTCLVKVNKAKVCVSRFETEDELISTIINELKQAIRLILAKKPLLKIVMTPIVGVSIADYNNRKDNGPRQVNEKTPVRVYEPDPYQHVINNAISDLNNGIMELNNLGNLETPLACIKIQARARQSDTHIQS